MNHFVVLREFDDFTRSVTEAVDSVPVIVQSYKNTLEVFEEVHQKWRVASENCDRLSLQLSDAHQQITDLEKQLQFARRLVDEEKLKTKRAIEERNYYEGQVDLVRDVLDKSVLLDETREKLSFLRGRASNDFDRLDTIEECDTTGSMMTDLSYTRDEDDILSETGGKHRKKRPKAGAAAADPSPKRRKSTTIRTLDVGSNESSARVVATTTVTVERNKPITATTSLEAGDSPVKIITVRSPQPMESDSEDVENLNGRIKRYASDETVSSFPLSMNAINTRPHTLIQKAMIKGETCNVCGKRIRFSNLGLKCKDCRSICHSHCKDLVPLPCVPIGSGGTPGKNREVTIADCVPMTPPMIPALVIHCIKEIESRGLRDIGLYRIPGSGKEVKALKEKFMKNKGVPNLSEVSDVHVICGCLKEFLRGLKEPLATQIRWDELCQAAEIQNDEERRTKLYQIICDLPRPNRDTIAFIILHLQRVAKSPDSKMCTSNLASVFGPTIVGYSKRDTNLFDQTAQCNRVMGELLELPPDYYQILIRDCGDIGSSSSQHSAPMPKTPSTHSLKNFFTPNPVKPLKKTKIFETP